MDFASYFSTGCALQPNHYTSLLGNTAGPIIISLLIGIYCFVRTRLGGAGVGLRTRCMSSFLLIS